MISLSLLHLQKMADVAIMCSIAGAALGAGLGEACRRIGKAAIRHLGLDNPVLTVAISVTRHAYQNLPAEASAALHRELKSHLKAHAHRSIKFGKFEFSICGFLQVRIQLSCRSDAIDLCNAIRRAPELTTTFGLVKLAVRAVKDSNSRFERDCLKRRQFAAGGPSAESSASWQTNPFLADFANPATLAIRPNPTTGQLAISSTGTPASNTMALTGAPEISPGPTTGQLPIPMNEAPASDPIAPNGAPAANLMDI